MPYSPWMLGMVDEAGHNGSQPEHINKVAESLLSTGLDTIDRDTFERACLQNHIDPACFTQMDLDKVQAVLNDEG